MALPSPRFPDPRDAPALRWGILAPGAIAHTFANALHTRSGQRVVAAASRSLERAEAFAREFGLERAYDDYRLLVSDPEVDVVYVAATHNAHEELALLAIEAGKHVLVEKPAAVSAASAQRIADAARDAGVFAMEAMWTRYLPHIDVIRQLLENGELGDVRVVAADFGVGFPFDPDHRIYDPAKAGGGLLDLGVYPIAFATFALPELNASPSVHVAGSLAATGVDGQTALILETDAGAQALVSTSVFAQTPATASISGTAGRVEVAGPFWSPSSFVFTPAEGEPQTYPGAPGFTGGEGMAFEAAALARYVTDGLLDSPIYPFADAIAVLRIIDDARRRLGYTAGLEE
jgi:predicted dehydrogenase